MTPKKASKKFVIRHFPETATDKKVAKLDEILAKYEVQESEINELKRRVSSLEDAQE